MEGNLKPLIRVINKILKNNRGSFSLEAMLTLPVFIICMVVFSICLRGMFIYEMMDNCFSNVAEDTAGSILFASVSHRQGIAENIARISLVDYTLQREIEKTSSKWAKKIDDKQGFEIIEEEFDYDKGVGVYSLNYEIPLIANKKLSCQHKRRIRSVWQYENTMFLSGDYEKIDDNTMVYTSNRGRKVKIYHSDKHCWALNRSYKKEGSVQSENISELSGYTECKICQKNRQMKLVSDEKLD